MSNLKSSYDENRKGKHVVIKTDVEMGLISVEAKPLLQHLSKNRPSTLLLKNDSKQITRNRSKSIDSQKKSGRSCDKFHKLKEKFILHSSPDLNDVFSDNESTPLVSEKSTPSSKSSGQNSVEHNTDSLPISPVFVRSPGLKHDRQTRSEQNLTDTSTNITPLDRCFYIGSTSDNGAKLLPLSRTMSESTNLGVASSFSSFSLLSSKGSGHLFRQNALDSEENLADIYCDPCKD